MLANGRTADFFKELAQFVFFDMSFSPEDFTSAQVFLPLTLAKLDGATIATSPANWFHRPKVLVLCGFMKKPGTRRLRERRCSEPMTS